MLRVPFTSGRPGEVDAGRRAHAQPEVEVVSDKSHFVGENGEERGRWIMELYLLSHNLRQKIYAIIW